MVCMYYFIGAEESHRSPRDPDVPPGGERGAKVLEEGEEGVVHFSHTLQPRLEHLRCIAQNENETSILLMHA